MAVKSGWTTTTQEITSLGSIAAGSACAVTVRIARSSSVALTTQLYLSSGLLEMFYEVYSILCEAMDAPMTATIKGSIHLPTAQYLYIQ